MKKKQPTKQNKSIKVIQIKSAIGRKKIQKKHLLALGLNKIGQTKILTLNNSISGLIKKVNHLIKIDDQK